MKNIVTLEQAREAVPHLLGKENTAWTNPTSDTVRVEIGLGPVMRMKFPATVDQDSGMPVPERTALAPTEIHIEVAPGATVEIPKAFDRAIQDVRANGAIVLGCAPQLRRADGTSPPTKTPTRAARAKLIAD